MTNAQELYRQKLVTLSDAVSLVASHQTIGTALCASEPVGLLTELGRQAGRLEHVTVLVCLPLRPHDFLVRPEMAGHVSVQNWFYSAADRGAHPQGRISYIPNNLHAAASAKLEAAGGHVDVFWGTATPPDGRGFMSLGLSMIVEKQLLEAADLVVLEVNAQMPWTLGDTQVHVSDVDYVVENDLPIIEMPPAPPAAWEQDIGGYIAELIEDGSTIQLGIGGIPNAIAAFLMERRDLGVHTELFTDGMVDLYEAGVITGRRKTLWKGKMVGTFALGTRKLYDFVDDNLGVEFQQGRVTNDPYVIAQNARMVSVNTALQVDIAGQVCSQSLGPRQYSGTGGQLDTHRGAQMSPGGRGIIALHSTARDGTVSTIVPMLSEGAGVTIPSQDVDTVVTEYGVAELKGRSVRERMEDLIGIAHPDFRGWIREEAARLQIVPRLVVAGFTPPAGPRFAPTAPGVTAETIRLGSFGDLSGPNATVGMAAVRGYSAWYEHVNRGGGVHGRHLSLVIEDDGFDPRRTERAVRKLVEEDGVFAIVSPLGTPTNLAVQDYLVERGVPVISPHSGLSTWAEPLKRTYFALQPSYRVEGRILAQYVLAAQPAGRVAVFAVDDAFGREGAAAFTEELNRAGRSATILPHAVGESAPERWVAELVELQPDLVLLYTYVKPAADLLRAAHVAGLGPAWVGSYVISGPDLFRLAGPEATAGLRATSYPLGPKEHRGERLYRRLMARRYADETPGTHSRIGYAAAQLVVEGLRRAGSQLTRSGFLAALEGIRDWTGGLLPPISYSPDDHRGLTALALLQAIRGHWLMEQGLLQLQETRSPGAASARARPVHADGAPAVVEG